jgi:hypothetical protein
MYCKNKTKKNDTCVVIKYGVDRINFRIIKYTIDDKLYCLRTTIHDEGIEYFRNIYWKRWKVETNFKYSKYNLSMNNIKSKSKESMIRNIRIHNFIFIIGSYL